jgi:protein arginine kinase activator
MKCPITGKLCLNPKEITVTNIEVNKATHMYLCKECGADYLQMPADNIVSKTTQMSTTPNGIVHKTKTTNESPEMIAPCPECGATLNDILTSQKISCPNCYKFHKHLNVVMTQIEPNEVPSENDNTHEIDDHVQELEKQMRKAIKEENYEEAAKIRDEIRKIKKTN